MSRPEVEPSGEAGFVLVSVLGIVALFVAAAAGLAVKAHLHLVQTQRLADAARLDAMADGAALFVIDALRVPPPSSAAAPVKREALPTDGRPMVCPLDAPAQASGLLAEVRISDAGGLLDLNAAPAPMLSAFLRAAALDERAAGALAGTIAAVRLPPADGEPERRGPFLDVGELSALQLGSGLDALAPLLTVDNPAPSLDIAVMDAAARALLPPDAERSPELRPWFAASRAETFRIEVAILGDDGWARSGRRAVAVFGKNRTGVPTLRRWSRLPVEMAPRPAERLEVSAYGFCNILAAALGPATGENVGLSRPPAGPR